MPGRVRGEFGLEDKTGEGRRYAERMPQRAVEELSGSRPGNGESGASSSSSAFIISWVPAWKARPLLRI